VATIYEMLRERLIQNATAAGAATDAFLQNERNAYWQWLSTSSMSDAARLEKLGAFDQAMARLSAEANDRHAGSDHQAARRASRSGSPRRDVLFLVLGTMLGIPAGMFSNYLYDWLFPKDPTVIEQVGVQGLMAPSDGFFFLKSKLAQINREGWIDVRYAMGTDTRRYRCTVTVSEPTLLERYGFDPGCKRVSFRFKDPSLLWREWDQTNSAVVFSVKITSEKNQHWEGSQGIRYAFYSNL
jgi:hypothetical protein